MGVTFAIAMTFTFFHSVVWAELYEVEQLRTEHTRFWRGDDLPGAAYTELACGLHWNCAAPGDPPLWLPTKLAWEPQADGSAIVVEAPRGVWLSSSLKQHPCLITEPADNQLPPLQFTFHGLGYLNPHSGDFAWIGRGKDSPLQLEGALAFYRDVVEGVDASWVVQHKGDGLSAGLVLHELPPAPSLFGFSPEDPVSLVVVSEVVCPNDEIEIGRRESNRIIRSTVKQTSEVPWAHQQIAWFRKGANKAHFLSRGRAYMTESGLAIGKGISGWGAENDVHSGMIRTETGCFLYYEGIPYEEMMNTRGDSMSVAQWDEGHGPRIKDLSSITLGDQTPLPCPNLHAQRLARIKLARSGIDQLVSASTEFASARAHSALPGGVFIDYETIDSSITTPLTLESGRTYYVSSGINLSSELTLQGGAVVKMGGPGRFTLLPGGSVKTETTAYQPATIVSKNCDALGAVISGSTGTPARGDCQRGFELDYQQSGTLEHLRIAHAWLGIRIYSGDWTIRHCIIRDNYTGLEVRENSTAAVGNVLFNNNGYWAIRMWLSSTEIPQVTLTNVTVDGSLNYIARYDLIGTTPATTALSVINSAFKGGYGAFYDNRSLANITLADGFDHCAFGHATEPPISMRTECMTVNDWSQIYTSTTLGDYYLSPVVGAGTNPLINAGVDQEGITADLLEGRSAIVPLQLPAKILKTNHPLSGWLGLAPRDGDQGPNDTPDLGYHYPAVDGLVGNEGLVIEGELYLGPGRVLALEGPVTVDTSGTAEFLGSPQSPIIVVPSWQLTDQLRGYRPGEPNDQFTALSILDGAPGGSRVEHVDMSGFHRCLVIDPTIVGEVAHSEFRPYEIGLYPFNQAGLGELTVRNCLFVGIGEGVTFGIFTHGNAVFVESSTFYNLRNPLLSGGGGSLSALNCLFARYPGLPTQGSFDHCGYWDCSGLPFACIPANAISPRQCIVNPFAQGPLGGFYLNSQTGGGDLLRGNAQDSGKGGSGPATDAGLFPWTVAPQETIAGSGEISIGYHYPSRLDTDGDGAWDATEDSNGNGQVDSGDDRSDYTDPDDVPYWMIDQDGNGLWDEDEDRDGLPDAWEKSVGLNTYPTGDPYDRDGMFGNPDGDENCNIFELMQAALPMKAGVSGVQLEQLINNSLSTYQIDVIDDSWDCGGFPVTLSTWGYWGLPGQTENGNTGYIFEITMEAEVEKFDADIDYAGFMGFFGKIHVWSIDHPAKTEDPNWNPNGIYDCDMSTEVSNPIWKHWLNNIDGMHLFWETGDDEHHKDAGAQLTAAKYIHVEFEDGDGDDQYGWDDFTCTWHPNLHHTIKGIHLGESSEVDVNFTPDDVSFISIGESPSTVLSSAQYTNQTIRLEAGADFGCAQVRAKPDNTAFDGLGYWPPNSFGVMVLNKALPADVVLVRVHRPGVSNQMTMSVSTLQDRLDFTYYKQAYKKLVVKGDGDNPWSLNSNYDLNANGILDWPTEAEKIIRDYNASPLPGLYEPDHKRVFILDIPHPMANIAGSSDPDDVNSFIFKRSNAYGIARHEIGHLLGLEDLDEGAGVYNSARRDAANVMSYWSPTDAGIEKNLLRADQSAIVNGASYDIWWDEGFTCYPEFN